MQLKGKSLRELLNTPVGERSEKRAPRSEKRAPESLICVIIAITFALVAAGPLLVSIKAILHCEPIFLSREEGQAPRYLISFFVRSDFDQLMHGFVFPFAALASVVVYVLAWLRRKKEGLRLRGVLRDHITVLLFVILAGWILINVYLINGPTFYAIHGILPHHENLFLYLEYYFCFFLMGTLLVDKKWKGRLFDYIALVGLLLIPFALFLRFKTDADGNSPIKSVFTHYNYYGIYLNMMISLSAAMLAGKTSPRRKVFYALTLAVNTVVLYYNNTLNAWVGALFACVFLIVASRIWEGKFNKWTWIAMGLFLFFLIVPGIVNELMISHESSYFAENVTSMAEDVSNLLKDSGSQVSQQAGNGRWLIWTKTMKLIREHPFVGIGMDGIRALDLKMFFDKYWRPHNEYMQYALFFGIPAAIIYFLACLSVYIRALKYKVHLDSLTMAALTVAFGYLVGAFFCNTTYMTTPYLYMMLGMGFVRIRKGTEDRRELEQKE